MQDLGKLIADALGSSGQLTARSLAAAVGADKSTVNAWLYAAQKRGQVVRVEVSGQAAPTWSLPIGSGETSYRPRSTVHAVVTVHPERVARLTEKVEEWIERLLDLTRRNNLLYFRDPATYRQSLPLNNSKIDALLKLLSGTSVTVSDLFPDGHEGPIGQTEALDRMRRIRAKAKENREERSIETLYLAVGDVTWPEEGAQSVGRSPRAPLLLVPAEVVPGSRRGDFKISIYPEDWELNKTLAYRLLKEFGIRIGAGEEVAPETEATTDLVLLVRNVIAPQLSAVPGAEVSELVMVGNFSFAKLAMVQDLEESTEQMASHDLTLAIAEDPDAAMSLRNQPESVGLDHPNQLHPRDEFLILDADSSQNEVINAIIEGRSFAFDGPPGTGKSQTIANAIAALSARGKKILFVAEKRVAIDAVVRRLADKGLANLVMDFHGTDRKKSEVIENLKRTEGAMNPQGELNHGELHEQLVMSRQHLLDQSTALHEVRSPFGISVYDLLVMTSEGESEVGFELDSRVSAKALRGIMRSDVAGLSEKVEQFARLGGFRNTEGAELWKSSTAEHDDEIEELLEFLSENQESELRGLFTNLSLLATDLGLDLERPEELLDAAELFQRIFVFQQENGWSVLKLDLDVLVPELERAQSFARPLWWILRPEYRRGLARVRAAVGTKIEARQALKVADDALSLRREWGMQYGNTPFPVSTPNHNDEGLQAFESLNNLNRLLEIIPNARLDLLESVDAGVAICENLWEERAIGRSAVSLSHLERQLQLAGFRTVIEELSKRQIPPEKASAALRSCWARSLAEWIISKDTRLASDDSTLKRNTASQFGSLDPQHLSTTPDRIKRKWIQNYRHVVQANLDESAYLNRVYQRKRNLPPVRELFAKSPNVLSALKPCWVMSPLSVSMLRPPVGWFDVVIFDEASQVLPADAITAIKSAKQFVVAGDDQQLPPTPFFASGDSSDDEVGETEGNDQSEVVQVESVLALTKSLVTRPRQLRWHYRSRDGRLIGFSNHKIYRDLITFPDTAEESPIRHIRVPNGVTAVSTHATNQAEVQTVVELVKEHARECPSESLGVIALGTPHANAIEDALEIARTEDAHLDVFMAERDVEPFFVKNLERVQGDERDAILLAIGYGRKSDNEIGYNFGPINGKNGQRRLNVATTRAKHRMTVVSTFVGEELEKQKCRGGLAFLRDYLIYAQSRGEHFGDTLATKPNLNAFEQSVMRALEDAGLNVVPQLGVGPYAIDFAVRHPSEPSKFVLAIECDGASYHSQPTARERDRLRQQALEARGWTFHRIWSTNWFTKPEAELSLALKSYEAAVKRKGDS